MGKHEVMSARPAIFFDRDGVINELVFNPDTGEYEPPHNTGDLIIIPDAIETLLLLQENDFEFFLVSNQPDYAKGKTTLESILAVHDRLDSILKLRGVHFRDYYYCFHHPKGIVPGYSCVCECRKPSPYFLVKAARDYHIDLKKSWMIGDRDSDIECGKAAGTRTIMIENPHSSEFRRSSKPDYVVRGIAEIASIIKIRPPDILPVMSTGYQ